METKSQYQVIPLPPKPQVVDSDGGCWGEEIRYAIADMQAKVVDDAQGYGYKSKQNACKAMWYKFQGGKSKTQSIKNRARVYWASRKDIAKAIENMLEDNFREISRGEYTTEDVIKQVETEFKTSLDREMTKALLR